MLTFIIVLLSMFLLVAILVAIVLYFDLISKESELLSYKARVASLTADVELLCDERTTVIMEELSLPPERRRICHGCELIKNKYNPDNNIASIEVNDDTDELDFSNIIG